MGLLQTASKAFCDVEPPHPLVDVLQSDTDIPPAARALLADEREALEAAAAGRRDRPRERRRPTAAAAATTSAAASDPAVAATAASGADPNSAMEDPEVRLVFDKLVGGLTKQGRKNAARRVVLDAMRIMRQALRKGNLDDVK
ncbi:hypothetical protein GPECTOR_12g352 [Gonium pectorale]|uniref:Uncharacterized protein n=1 Tax=Gonium pectorale TaxID=33097 RepID=A0A150GPX2_GONPE|nr:hypothetical protein GPECTOR_12g352 [Gonium pectorale]|eukprot:KXZ51390.1 hypothetical protein GPECTOR_12g352 [Gonium pectorale]